jgi:hypothetical protein
MVYLVKMEETVLMGQEMVIGGELAGAVDKTRALELWVLLILLIVLMHVIKAMILVTSHANKIMAQIRVNFASLLFAIDSLSSALVI